MAHIVTDRVRETTTTTGTGAITLGGAVSGYQDFDSQMANADTTVYAIVHRTAAEWEVGFGTWNTGNTLSRTTVVRSSNSNAAVSLSAGTKDIFMTFTPSVRQPGMTFSSTISPATSAGAALGTTSLPWGALHIASGFSINWANGEVTLTGAGNQLVVDGGSLLVDVGTATIPPLQFDPTGAVLLSTPAVGAVEIDATNFYGTTDAGNRGYIPVRHFTRLAANRNLTSTTNEQSIFGSSEDVLTLETGVYKFESLLRFTSMSATSGNARIDWLGAGTATVDTWAWWYEALDNSSPSPGPIAPTSVGWPFQDDSAASIAVAAVGTALAVVASGTFDVTSAGTINPIIDLVTAAVGVVTAGSYFMCERMGATDVLSVGQWG